MCLAHSATKDRKAIIKAVKPFVLKLARDEFGHTFLIGALLLVDDTVLTAKAILHVATSIFLSLCNVVLGILEIPERRRFRQVCPPRPVVSDVRARQKVLSFRDD